jgi:hypothetical protein
VPGRWRAYVAVLAVHQREVVGRPFAFQVPGPDAHAVDLGRNRRHEGREVIDALWTRRDAGLNAVVWWLPARVLEPWEELRIACVGPVALVA